MEEDGVRLQPKRSWIVYLGFWAFIVIGFGTGVLAGVLLGHLNVSNNNTDYMQTSPTYTFPVPFGLSNPPLAYQAAAVAASIGPGILA